MTSESLKKIAFQGIDAVRPGVLLKPFLKYCDTRRAILVDGKWFEVKPKSTCCLVGFGKAVLGMAEELCNILGNDVINSGILSIPEGTLSLKDYPLVTNHHNLKIYEGAKNNLPDENSLFAASKIRDLVSSLNTEDDLLIVLISGGGSALLPAPIDPITLDEKLQVIKNLSNAGASIQELNIVRIALSKLKGGKLASLAFPARVISFILSDIVGDPLDLIASGPTLCIKKRNITAEAILKKYQVKVTPSVEKIVKQEAQCEELPSSQCNSTVTNVLIGNNQRALEACYKAAQDFNYNAVILSDKIQGISSQVGADFILLASGLAQRLNCGQIFDSFKTAEDIRCVVEHKFQELKESGKPLCLIGGGETVVTVTGKGKGGRNQEMALAASIVLRDEIHRGNMRSICVDFLSLGTDGQDGPTDAAGAIVGTDFTKLPDMKGKSSKEFLLDNNSYEFFMKVNKKRNLLKIGHTGTNVMDIQLMLLTLDKEATTI